LQSGHLDRQQPQVEAVEQSRAPIAFQTNGQIVRISSTGNKISGYFWHKLWFHQPKAKISRKKWGFTSKKTQIHWRKKHIVAQLPLLLAT